MDACDVGGGIWFWEEVVNEFGFGYDDFELFGLFSWRCVICGCKFRFGVR